MSFDRATQGEPLALSAEAFNATLDAAEDFIARGRGRDGARPVGTGPGPALTVWVRNDTGADVGSGGVYRIGTAITLPSSDRFAAAAAPSFAGLVPDAASNPVAVCAAPLAAGEIGLGVVVGVTVCEVNVVNSGHRYAAPLAGSTARLRSASSGPIRLLFAPGVGVGLCYVQLISWNPEFDQEYPYSYGAADSLKTVCVTIDPNITCNDDGTITWDAIRLCLTTGPDGASLSAGPAGG